MAEITPLLNSEPVLRWKKPVLLTALVLFALYASTHMVAAGDTWVALACGRHFAHHGVDTVEPFSFNSHPAGPTDEQLAAWPEWTHGMIRFWHPTGWINQNWLTHLSFYKLVTWFGSEDNPNYDMLVYWKFALFGAAVFVVFALGKVLGAGDFLSMTAACFAMVVGRSFYDIRPACYSNLLVPLFILLLALSTYKHSKYIWLMVPLIIFWANVHGGYIYAYMMLAPFLAVHILLNLPRRWTLALGLSGLWMVLYLLFYKFHQNTYYAELVRALNLSVDKVGFVNGFLGTGVFLAAVSLLLAAVPRIPAGLFYAFHAAAALVYPVVLLTGMSLKVPSGVNPQYLRILNHSMTAGLIGFLLLLLLGVLIVVLLAIRKERFVRISNRTLGRIIAAGGVSFLAMILFNPFRLTNLTHTFEISISEHAASWRSVNEWRPAFDWMDPTTERANPVGDEEAFAVMCVIGLVVFIPWAVLQMLKPALRPVRKGPRQTTFPDDPSETGWPRIDIALILVGALTIYMAVQSRRFIALAGPSASPVLAMFAFQIGQMFTARRNWKTTQTLQPSLPPLLWQKYVWLATTGLLVVLGTYWGWKYYRVYLGPWPADDVRNSVFMRMTDSNKKPFEVCQFINANKLTGRIFNFWTEGGGLVFGQTPDPETGKTPLQHFMDGRAQAAFDHDTFKLWQHIHAGGPIAEQILRTGQTPNADEIKQIGRWLSDELKSRQVWIALMPKAQSDSTFMRALLATSNWKTAFIDDMQHLMVDSDSQPGRQLIADIFEGRAVFPDEFSKNMTLLRLTFETNDPRHVMNVFDYAQAAFRTHPYPSAMIGLVQVSRAPAFRDRANQAIRDYLEAFLADREELARRSGYLQRLASADIAARHLAYVNPEEKTKMDSLSKSFGQESAEMQNRHMW
jgi:hypothetical protein